MSTSEIETLAKRLRKARKGLGLTQAQLAEKAGISVSYYPLIERAKNEPSLGMLRRLAKALGVKPSDLID